MAILKSGQLLVRGRSDAITPSFGGTLRRAILNPSVNDDSERHQGQQIPEQVVCRGAHMRFETWKYTTEQAHMHMHMVMNHDPSSAPQMSVLIPNPLRFKGDMPDGSLRHGAMLDFLVTEVSFRAYHSHHISAVKMN